MTSKVWSGDIPLIVKRKTHFNFASSPVRNVVLVHGLYADGACWLKVPHLRRAGLNVAAVQNPLHAR